MVNALGASGSVFANALANQADLIIGIGTRYTDFTTASNTTMFSTEGVQFVNINVTELDAYKESALGLVGDARESLLELADLLGGIRSTPPTAPRSRRPPTTGGRGRPDRRDAERATLSQAEAIGIVNAAAGDHHVVVNAAGSMPGDLHRLWRPSDPKAYDLEYGNSCMGYEVGDWAPRWPTRPATSSASSVTAPSCCPARRS